MTIFLLKYCLIRSVTLSLKKDLSSFISILLLVFAQLDNYIYPKTTKNSCDFFEC